MNTFMNSNKKFETSFNACYVNAFKKLAAFENKIFQIEFIIHNWKIFVIKNRTCQNFNTFYYHFQFSSRKEKACFA